MNNIKCKMCGRCCADPTEHNYACILEEIDLNNKEIVVVAIEDGNRFGDLCIPYINGKCPFLINNLCLIHTNKPVSCKLYNCATAMR